MGYYRLLVKQESQLKNHKEALTAKDADKTLIKSVDKQIKALKKEQKKIIDSMKETIKKDDKLLKKFNSIVSIKGVGDTTALILLHMFMRYPNANQRQIVSLAGLDPIIKESGTSVRGRTKISKAGDKIYRASLFMPTMVAIRYNKKLKGYYQRLKDNGKHTTVAQVAVMRKILITAHSLYKSEQTYKEE